MSIWTFLFGGVDSNRPFAHRLFGHSDLNLAEIAAMRDDELENIKKMFADGLIDEAEVKKLKRKIKKYELYQVLDND